jgi:hypothetical protein
MSKILIFELPFEIPGKKCHLDVALQKVIEYIIGKGVVPLPKGYKLCKV